jgi:hypothetical protein
MELGWALTQIPTLSPFKGAQVEVLSRLNLESSPYPLRRGTNKNLSMLTPYICAKFHERGSRKIQRDGANRWKRKKFW